MIAVFTRYQKMFDSNFNFYPKEKFVRIKNVWDIRGRKFEGVILYVDWYEGDQCITNAYEELKIKQPELFK